MRSRQLCQLQALSGCLGSWLLGSVRAEATALWASEVLLVKGLNDHYVVLPSPLCAQ